MIERFDSVIIGAFELAQAEALRRNNPELTPDHFLFGLIKHPKSTAAKHLKPELNSINQKLDQLPKQSKIDLKNIRTSSSLSEWITLATSSSLESGKENITEADFLKHLARFYPQIKFAPDSDESEAGPPDFLEDLNALAISGKLDPVIGRSMEIRKLMEILSRRSKNNPVLVGMAGVGKTAIVEGLAGLIVKNQVPDIIQGRTVYALQMGTLMAGTKYRGEFEEKIEQLLKFLKQKGRDAILFIDELHLLIGAGKTDGAIDAANLLKPALARGELNCIGATTLEEYKKYIESDSALERRFHKILVEAPSVEDTIQILTGLKEKLEIHHAIEITSEAIVAAAKLSNQYINDRNLPDKAIDVLDEAAAALKLNAQSPPAEVQELESDIASKQILLSALSNNDKSQTSELKKEIESLQASLKEQKEAWEKSGLELKKATNLKKELDNAQFEFEKNYSQGNYEEASRLKYTVIDKLTKDIQKLQLQNDWKLGKKDIALVIHNSTGIPLDKILSDPQEHLTKLAPFLKSQVLGQDAAINEISDTLIASHTGLTDQGRTLGSFLLLGPSGVGKTETAKQLAVFLFNDERALIRFDLSEFRESHAIAKLIGPPPGYIGYEQGGALTEAVRRKPYCVVLFDEIEKAHIDFGDILLQIIDDGRLSDSHGHIVNFNNAVIIVTSNLSDYKSYLKPELIGRFDSIIQYQTLSQSTISLLVQKELDLLNAKLVAQEFHFDISDSARKKIIQLGFDEQYGARPLKNIFNKIVIKPISKFLIKQDNKPGSYRINLKDQVINIEKIT